MRKPPLRAVVVQGDSMLPALRPGDCLLVLLGGRARVGDIVVAHRPHVPALQLVKRVARREPGGWYLLSDNPAAGLDDSRAFGAIPESELIGRVLFRYYRPAVNSSATQRFAWWSRSRARAWSGRRTPPSR
jgi:nickel-type superoxide dismutase maturation protease